MAVLNDFSQLKSFKPAPAQTPVPPTPPATPEERALAGAETSTDYFSSLLGGGNSAKKKGAEAAPPPRRTTRVTPNTIARVREEQVAEAIEKERAAFKARESELLEQLQEAQESCEIEKSVSAEFYANFSNACVERDALKKECAALRRDLDARREAAGDLEAKVKRLEETLRAERAKAEARPAAPDPEELAARDREIERLQGLLAAARSDTRLHGALLDAPEPFSEKFAGEVREHVVDTLVKAQRDAEMGGRERRAYILEAVLGANPPSGDLESRRKAVERILRTAGSHLDTAQISALEKIGFHSVSKNGHHKIDWAGIRLTLAATPSDYRSNLNAIKEICNRVF